MVATVDELGKFMSVSGATLDLPVGESGPTTEVHSSLLQSMGDTAWLPKLDCRLVQRQRRVHCVEVRPPCRTLP